MSKTDTLHITCAIDDDFIYPLTGMLMSLLEHHPHLPVRIHLFSASLHEERVRFLEDIISKKKSELHFYHLSEKHFGGLPVNDRISRAAYYRILMPGHLPEDVERFIYLDADLLVTGDLSGFFNIDLQGMLLAAVNDVSAIQQGMHHKHNIPSQYQYFNSGVLLVDRRLWERNGATEKVMNYIRKNHERCLFHDQDGLNATLYEMRLPVSPKWNFQAGMYYINRDFLEEVYSDDLEHAFRDPVIVHFNGIEKPWHFTSGHPYKKSFLRHASPAAVFRVPEKIGTRKRIKKYIVNNIIGWNTMNKYHYRKQMRQQTKKHHQ